MFSVIESCKHLLIGLKWHVCDHTHHNSEARRLQAACWVPTQGWAPELSLGVVVKKVRTVRSLGALVLKSHCFLFFSSWFPNGLCSSSSCLLPNMYPERILPSKQVCKPACAGWQKCFVNVTVENAKGWISRRVVIEFNLGFVLISWFIGLGFLISRIKI